MSWATLLFCLDRKGRGYHGIVFSVFLDKTKGYSPGTRVGRTNINAAQRERKGLIAFFSFCYIIVIIIKYPQLGETKEYYYYFYHVFSLSHSPDFERELSTC